MEEAITTALHSAYDRCKQLNTISPDSPAKLNAVLRKPKRRALGTWSTNSVIRAAHSKAGCHEAEHKNVIALGVAREWASAVVDQLRSVQHVTERPDRKILKIQFVLKDEAEKCMKDRLNEDAIEDSDTVVVAVDVAAQGFINLYSMTDFRSTLSADVTEDSLHNTNPCAPQNNYVATFRPIAFVRSCYRTKFCTPRQSSIAARSRGVVELVRTLDGQSLQGLEDYSHCWLIWNFHDEGKSYLSSADASPTATTKNCKTVVRPPMLGGKTCGVFASRSPHRPCAIGLSMVRILSVSHQHRRVFIAGLDLIDFTPVLDIKPVHPMDFAPLSLAPTPIHRKCDHSEPRHTQDSSSGVDAVPPASGSPVATNSNSDGVGDGDGSGDGRSGDGRSGDGRSGVGGVGAQQQSARSWWIPNWVANSAAEQQLTVDVPNGVISDFHEWIVNWRDMQTKKDVMSPGPLGGLPPFAFFETEYDFLETMKCSLQLDARSPQQQRDHLLGSSHQMLLDNFEVIFQITEASPSKRSAASPSSGQHGIKVVVDSITYFNPNSSAATARAQLAPT